VQEGLPLLPITCDPGSATWSTGMSRSWQEDAPQFRGAPNRALHHPYRIGITSNRDRADLSPIFRGDPLGFR
jgi:hypothetical protein